MPQTGHSPCKRLVHVQSPELGGKSLPSEDAAFKVKTQGAWCWFPCKDAAPTQAPCEGNDSAERKPVLSSTVLQDGQPTRVFRPLSSPDPPDPLLPWSRAREQEGGFCERRAWS